MRLFRVFSGFLLSSKANISQTFTSDPIFLPSPDHIHKTSFFLYHLQYLFICFHVSPADLFNLPPHPHPKSLQFSHKSHDFKLVKLLVSSYRLQYLFICFHVSPADLFNLPPHPHPKSLQFSHKSHDFKLVKLLVSSFICLWIASGPSHRKVKTSAPFTLVNIKTDLWTKDPPPQSHQA